MEPIIIPKELAEEANKIRQVLKKKGFKSLSDVVIYLLQNWVKGEAGRMLKEAEAEFFNIKQNILIKFEELNVKVMDLDPEELKKVSEFLKLGNSIARTDTSSKLLNISREHLILILAMLHQTGNIKLDKEGSFIWFRKHS